MDNKKRVFDLILFLDVCQLYVQSRKKSTRNLCTLWAIVTFVRDEDSTEFLRWCQAYNVKHLRQQTESQRTHEQLPSTKDEKIRIEMKILRTLQELFQCGCFPGDLTW